VLVAHVRNPSYFLIAVRSQPRQIVHKTLSQKTPSQERAGGVAQGDVLSSNPSTTKKKAPVLPPPSKCNQTILQCVDFRVFFFHKEHSSLWGFCFVFETGSHHIA
jgi:hypothetical protein